MTLTGNNLANDHSDIQTRTSLIREIAENQYGAASPLLIDILNDIIALYQGKWEAYQACITGYHNLGHAIDVALLTARMTAGWNKVNNNERPSLEEELFLAGVAAALFHDAGYIKEKGDNDGKGGKYSFNHEERSMAMSHQYLVDKNWPTRSIELVPKIISATKFHVPIEMEGLFATADEEVVGRMMASADLVAQMSDVNYIERIKDLYAELQEAYENEGIENLKKRGLKVFSSAQEMIDGTVGFYEKFVLPRLLQLGRMDQYLVSFFGDGRNPYLENIAANLSVNKTRKRNRWQRLGDVLKDLGLATREQINTALKLQAKSRRTNNNEKQPLEPLQNRLKKWLAGSRPNDKCLGELLMDMDAISPDLLRKGLLQQILPADTIKKLSRRELIFLLEISQLRQSIGRGPWLFDQILVMTNDLLACEGSCILLANPENQEMAVVAMPNAANNEQMEVRTIPTDKGLAGWVFSHGQPAVVNNVHQDDRFDSEIDSKVRQEFETRSVVAVPLHINGELIGVMEVINKKEGKFNEHDVDILSLLANIIAVSLDNIFRLHELYS